MNTVPFPILKPIVENIPTDLRQIPRWVVWRGQWLPGKGKYDKPPFNARTGDFASTTDPKTWAEFEQAVKAYQNGGGYSGLGIVLTDDDNLVGVDLDHVLDAHGNLTPDAARWVEHFDSYTEVSPSGRGLRIFVRATLPPGGRK